NRRTPPESPPPDRYPLPPSPPARAPPVRRRPGQGPRRPGRRGRGRPRLRGDAGTPARSLDRARRLLARLREQVGREPGQLAPRQVRTNEDAVRLVDALLDRRPQRVELGDADLGEDVVDRRAHLVELDV